MLKQLLNSKVTTQEYYYLNTASKVWPNIVGLLHCFFKQLKQK